MLDEKSINDIIDSDDEHVRTHGTDANVLMRMSTFESISGSGDFTLVLEADKGGLTAENIMIHHVRDNGRITRCRDACHNREQEAMCFTTDHFPVFMMIWTTA